MATRTIANAGGNWNTAATWVEASVPTASDDVVATATSGNVTIDAASVCRSIDLTGYTSTLTHGVFTLTVGTSTAQGSLVALLFPSSGWTYILSNVATSAITFTTTAVATLQTVNFGGKTTGNVTFTAPSGSGYQLVSNGFTNGATATVTHSGGTFDTNSQTCSWGTFNSSNANTRIITLGSSTITLTANGTSWNVVNANGLTITANTATVIQSGINTIFTGNNGWNGLSLQITGAGNAMINANNVIFANLSRVSTAIKTDTFQIQTNITVTGVLTLTGNSTINRLLVRSNVGGTARTITANGTIVATNADFMDITAAGTASWDLSAVSGGSGDALGNTGITFTPASTQTWQGTSGGSWSDNAKWTSRIPLAQDDVLIASAFTAAQTISVDMIRIGRNIDFTGTTGNPTWTMAIGTTLFGNITFASGMTMGGAFLLSLGGRNSNTVTTNGVALAIIGIGSAIQSNYTFTDNVTFGNTTTISAGTVTFQGNVTVSSGITLNNSGYSRTINMGSGVFTFNTTSALTVWNVLAPSGIVVNPGTSTMVVASASANTRSFVGGGLTYGNLVYTVAGSTGTLAITGANTFNSISVAGGRTFTLPAGTTTTISSAAGWQVGGTSGSLTTLNSGTPGSQATVSIASGTVSADYLALTDSAATGGATWYAGANSTSGGNNTGWVFSAPNGLEYWGLPI